MRRFRDRAAALFLRAGSAWYRNAAFANILWNWDGCWAVQAGGEHVRTWRRRAGSLRIASTTVLLSVGGCLATAGENLDLLLSRNAVESAARLPLSGVGPLLEFLLDFLRG